MEVMPVTDGIEQMNLPTPSTGPSMTPNMDPTDIIDGLEMSMLSESGDNAAEAENATLTPIVTDTLVAIQNDAMSRVVLTESCGWTKSLCISTALPLLCHTKNTTELILVDLLDESIVKEACSVIINTPTISSFVLVNSGKHPGLSKGSVECISCLLCSTDLRELSIMNCLHIDTPFAVQLLGCSLPHSRSLLRLNLEANGIQDSDFLPLAQGLASSNPLLSLCLDNNNLGYPGLDMLSEVMSFNERIQEISVNGNLIRCPTDVWEGYFIQEQCLVNREMQRLGSYTADTHSEWPSLWRRKMRKLWRLQFRTNESYKLSIPEWEGVLSWMDPRGYVEQKVKLWMKLEPPPRQTQQDINWRQQ
eukprot:TRINITY_DN21092_c0_g1_i1.p1 TRINITY_DN21092_c0_g1~~TRINITY_DN21092_c0_g1_i1.p1  ORF type:complete len:376 (+),score=74.53 TRINITY_DN21092_c0_g1_i1:45-1130(+)